MEDKTFEVNKAIEKIRPYIQRDGGDVELVAIKDDIVYVSVHGACVGCGMLNETLKEGIEAIILEEVPGISEVRLADEGLKELL